ncbi:Detected protein of unknown function [Hibiscus syriacus]|uniref:Uncharacterized protein n=1 Tax=Hibiscus syriacus TaxID=106335 RepID=A0A6A3AFF7_HIBSY|nr:Detected protein of unknown function [Hibiscus syriacus]
MAIEDANADQTQTYNTQENTTERSASSRDSDKFRFSKALALRAVYGLSVGRNAGNRKSRGDNATALPSRLSKVSLADDES